MNKVKAWFNNIRNYENLGYGGARTLSDIEKEYDRLVEENKKLKQSQEASPLETIVMRLKWPDVHFVIKYMVENINTERIDVNDQYGIEKLTDTVFSEYQNWKNKKEA